MAITLKQFCVAAVAAGMLPAAHADEALVAVAANFVDVMERLEARFERSTGHEMTVVSGSTGKLYAQITHGAPFDVFLAADQERPRLLEEKGLAVRGSRITYAIGRLVLWSPAPDRLGTDGAAILRQGEFRRLAIANPLLAPYGTAARQTLQALGLYETFRERLVIGENVGQAFAMVATGNAELGFVALSFVMSARNETAGSHWVVPQSYYAPIRQDGVLLERAAGNAPAGAFLRWLRTDEARTLIGRSGYGVK